MYQAHLLRTEEISERKILWCLFLPGKDLLQLALTVLHPYFSFDTFLKKISPSSKQLFKNICLTSLLNIKLPSFLLAFKKWWISDPNKLQHLKFYSHQIFYSFCLIQPIKISCINSRKKCHDTFHPKQKNIPRLFWMIHF